MKLIVRVTNTLYTCLHVILPLGMKYRYAKQWGIHCVSAQWFHDSVETGYSMPEANYDVDKEGQGGDGREEGGEGASGASRKRYVGTMFQNYEQSCTVLLLILHLVALYSLVYINVCENPCSILT